ncbi:MAG: MFS transporter, partial [Enterobacteriaceae bacterium]
LAGPNIARFTQNIGPLPFMVSFIALFILSIAALLLMTRIQIPPMVAQKQQGSGRPLLQIIRQPEFITALIGSSMGYAVMVMIMTATPLAMQSSGHAVGDAATVIQWHVLGMFVPSFFTGNLIRRYGVLPIMWLGVLFMAAHVLIALSGEGVFYYLSGLTLVGVGWNFLFIGGTTLLTRVYRPGEQAKTQATHDFLMFTATSLASFSAGGLLNAWGWQSVNYTASLLLAPVMLALMTLTLWYRREGHVAR